MTLAMTDRLDEVGADSTADEMRTAMADAIRMTADPAGSDRESS